MANPLTLPTIEDQLTSAIGQQETAGGTLGVGASMNNPGGLKFAPWEVAYGGQPGANGFASFPSINDGFDAMKSLIDKYITGGASLSSLIDKWAPASDGNTNNPQRTLQLSQITGLDPTQSILSQIGKQPNAPSQSTSIIGGALGEGAKNLSEAFQLNESFSWGRVTAFFIGIAFIIIGLLSMRQTQIVVQNVADRAAGAAHMMAAVA